MKPVQLWRYSIPSINGEGWAVFVLGSDGYFSACSDWGNYAFWWGDTGCSDFREFLLRADRDWSYFAGKLAPKQVYDGDKTEKYIKETILRHRKDGSLTKEEARSEWNLFINSEFGTEFGFYAWYLETTFSDAGEMAWHGTDSDAVQFVRKCMARLIPLLKADLEAGR